jgi:hypothetical protein
MDHGIMAAGKVPFFLMAALGFSTLGIRKSYQACCGSTQWLFNTLNPLMAPTNNPLRKKAK